MSHGCASLVVDQELPAAAKNPEGFLDPPSLGFDLEKGPVLPPDQLDIEPPAAANAPFLRVFLNHPAIGPDTPPVGPFYVGTVSFFATPAQHAAIHQPGGTNLVLFELPITSTLANLRARGPLADPLIVQLVPVALTPTAQQVEIKPAEVEAEFY